MNISDVIYGFLMISILCAFIAQYPGLWHLVCIVMLTFIRLTKNET